MQKRRQQIIQASWVSVVGNSLLAMLKIVAGFISGSFAVLADGIDSATDILSSVITLIAARVVHKPPTVKFPYGYIKADTIATKVLSLIIIVAGVQLFISSVGNLVQPAERNVPGMLALYVTGISIIGKLLLSLYLRTTGRQQNSIMLKTMSVHMQSDMLISVAVLFSLILTISLQVPLIDSVFALGISIFIVYTALKIFLKSNTELMDGLSDEELYNKLFEAVNSVEGASHPHRARARKIGSYYMINLDIEVDPEISVREAHDIAKNVEDKIKNNINRVYDVMVHMEPRGNQEKDEKFGVSEKHINSD